MAASPDSPYELAIISVMAGKGEEAKLRRLASPGDDDK